MASVTRPWRQAALWLACLAPFFYLSYGVANHLAEQRADVGAVVFGWERWIPFVAWTIVPYWSINLFYGLSLFLCRTRDQLHAHGRRLLTAQVVAVSCFLLFPLGFTFVRPATDGIPGLFFSALTSFDKPFNQAPSLHIALLVVLWDLYRRLLPVRWHGWLHGWSWLIAISVLTTYQHHFIDIPTGALLGLVCVWLWPLDGPSPLHGACWARDARRRMLALGYLLVASVCFALAAAFGAAALWLCWPGSACVLVALNYAWFGVAGFQKSARGRLSFAVTWLLLPYRIGAWLNARLWTRRDPAAVCVAHGVLLGRMPTRWEARKLGVTHLVDLSAELSPPRGLTTRSVPMLDLVAADSQTLQRAAEVIEAQRVAAGDGGRVLVCCALGYSRSVAATVAWLLYTGRATHVDAAIERLHRKRPNLVLYDAHRLALASLPLHS